MIRKTNTSNNITNSKPIEKEVKANEVKYSITDITDIDTKTEIGQLFVTALTILSRRIYTDKTPNSIIELLHTHSKIVFIDK
jgi:hypothetical protein